MKFFYWLFYFIMFSLLGIIFCFVLVNEVFNFINFIFIMVELNDDFLLEKIIRLELFIVENIVDLRVVELN